MGCNGYRTAHHAPTPELLDFCDSMGMLVMDENRKFSSSESVLDDLKTLILRDRNHPSVFMWSLENEENLEGTRMGARVLKKMHETVKQIDSTRMTVAAMNHGWNEGGYSDAVDVVGYNYGQRGMQYVKDHQLYPERKMIASESTNFVATRGEHWDNGEKGYMSNFGKGVSWGLQPGEDWKYIVDYPYWNLKGHEGDTIRMGVYTNCDEVEMRVNGHSLGRKKAMSYIRTEFQAVYKPGRMEVIGYRKGKVIARTFMEHYEPLLRSDWTVYRGAALFYEGTEDCTIENCDFINLGGNALFYSFYNRRNKIQGSHFTNIGASAILFVGDTAAVRSPSFEYGQFVPYSEMDINYGPKNSNYPEDCLVKDNLIHSIGLFEKQITGIELSMCHRITISHNSIYDVPRAGINVSEGTWGGHIIEYNDIFDTVKETGYHGSFNSWGRDRFWHPDYGQMSRLTEEHLELIIADILSPVIIRNNCFRCDRGWDIDLDDGSSCYDIYNNLLLNGGIKLREGFYRRVENNILVNNTLHPHVWFKNNRDVFRNNIVMSAYQPINLQEWGKEIDYNIFTSQNALSEARAAGTDVNSIYEPIIFVAPDKGNYTINQKHINAFRIGFKNFDMDSFGVISARLRALSRTPVMSLPVVIDETTSSQVAVWQGWSVKNIETMGERSATGMDGEHGLYIVKLYAFDSNVRDYFRNNDVILKINDIATDNIEELMQATSEVDKKHPVRVLVYRNQEQLEIVIPAGLIR